MPNPSGGRATPRDTSDATLLDYHLTMLHDAARMDAFRRAIAASVTPGDVVVDVGSGTGVLAFMACEAGARKVYAIEGGPIVELARELAADNGFADRITFVEGWSTEVELPERADVLVSETIGNAGFDEGILAWTIDARRRLLRPDPVLVPQRLRTWVAPVESADDHTQVSDWWTTGLPYDYAAGHRRALRTLWYVELTAANLLGEPVVAADVDLRTAADEPITGGGTLRVDRDGTLHGLACWFDALLCAGVTLHNTPPQEDSSWFHGFLPLAEPVPVTAGDQLRWEVQASADGEDWTWRVDRLEG